MVKHAYLIMAHNQWDILLNLLEALDDERNDIYLHIDKKVSPPQEQIRSAVSQSRMYCVEPANIVWGGTQMMECTLAMLEQASNGGYEYYHLLSGVDFPLKSQNYIHDFFARNNNQQYVGFDWKGIQSGAFLSRVMYYHFLINVIGKRNHDTVGYRLLAKMEDISLAVQSKFKVNRMDYEMYKGSSWFSISHALVMDILAEKSKILKRYRFTANSDEVWLQTFVKQSKFVNQIAGSNMRYVKWVQGNPSPESLTMADHEDLIASDKLFARKFDWSKDSAVILKLKEQISKG